MNAPLPNNPSRFWPEKDQEKDNTLSSAEENRLMRLDEHHTRITHSSSSDNISAYSQRTGTLQGEHRFVPRHSMDVERKKRKSFDSIHLRVLSSLKKQQKHTAMEKDEWHIGRMIDEFDARFEEQMRKDAEGFPILPPLAKKPPVRPDGYLPEDEDAYGVIHTGARGPKQTPLGALSFILFVVVFIVALMFFLVAFMSNVMY
jgi:hypothetical protein